MNTLTTVFLLSFVGALAAPSERILGGSDALIGEFPYQVSLQFCILTFQCVHRCGSSIISPSWILSAAHCITDNPDVGNYVVMVGVVDLDGRNPERQVVRVNTIIIHPDYQGGVNPHDVALFKLTSQLVLIDGLVSPIALPAPGTEIYGQAMLSGWGSNATSTLPQNRLQKIGLPVIPVQSCKSALETLLSGESQLDTEANVCTGPFTGGVSACYGDSGGPLAQNGVLVGIVSWGVIPCGTVGAPSGVYVKTSYYSSWIAETIDEPLTTFSDKSH